MPPAKKLSMEDQLKAARDKVTDREREIRGLEAELTEAKTILTKVTSERDIYQARVNELLRFNNSVRETNTNLAVRSLILDKLKILIECGPDTWHRTGLRAALKNAEEYVLSTLHPEIEMSVTPPAGTGRTGLNPVSYGGEILSRFNQSIIDDVRNNGELGELGKSLYQSLKDREGETDARD